MVAREVLYTKDNILSSRFRYYFFFDEMIFERHFRPTKNFGLIFFLHQMTLRVLGENRISTSHDIRASFFSQNTQLALSQF